MWKKNAEPGSPKMTLWRMGIAYWIKKVKCTLVQALRLRTGLMAHKGSRGIALIFLDRGTRRE